MASVPTVDSLLTIMRDTSKPLDEIKSVLTPDSLSLGPALCYPVLETLFLSRPDNALLRAVLEHVRGLFSTTGKDMWSYFGSVDGTTTPSLLHLAVRMELVDVVDYLISPVGIRFDVTCTVATDTGLLLNTMAYAAQNKESAILEKLCAINGCILYVDEDDSDCVAATDAYVFDTWSGSASVLDMLYDNSFQKHFLIMLKNSGAEKYLNAFPLITPEKKPWMPSVEVWSYQECPPLYYGLLSETTKLSVINLLANEYYKILADDLIPVKRLPPYDPAVYGEPLTAFSQKGASCFPDSTLMTFFVSPILQQIFNMGKSNSTNISASACVSLPSRADSLLTSDDTMEAKYKNIFLLAKQRYDRMPTYATLSEIQAVLRGNNRPVSPNIRYRYSINDSFSHNIARSMNTEQKPTAGLTTGISLVDERMFFQNIFTRNILSKTGINSLEFLEYSPTNLPSLDSVQWDNLQVIYFIVQSTDPKLAGHAMSIYKRDDGKWCLIDNNVGFVHVFMDQPWVMDVFLPRLIYTIADQKPDVKFSKSGGKPMKPPRCGININPDKKLACIIDSTLNPQLLYMQFIAIGGKSYPNRYFSFEDATEIYVPNMASFLFKKSAGVTIPAGGAGQGGGRYRRKTRRLQQNLKHFRKSRKLTT